MRNIKALALLAVVVFASACGWRRNPVPVIADSGSIRALVGTWSGQYNSEQTGRSGSIMFQLASEKDTAFGDVLMVPRAQMQPNMMTEHQPMPITPAQKPGEALTIRFVSLISGGVSGKLDPYNDPDYGCRVVTTFSGRFTGADTIEGTYSTEGVTFGHPPTSGQWKVTRQPTTTDTPR